MSSKTPLQLIVGLGNPGAEYTKTRHNAGFWFCERLAEELRASFILQSRFRALIARSGERCLLLPQTFMNRSGEAVQAFAHFHRIVPESMLVVHDDLDLLPGHVRLKFGGGLGGHNGLKDIARALATQDFWRLRLGIGRPSVGGDVVNFVLRPPPLAEEELILSALGRALTAWPQLVSADFEAAMRHINVRPTSD